MGGGGAGLVGVVYILYCLLSDNADMATGGSPETGYALMKSFHDKAYALISDALDFDETGNGMNIM